jgi:hypothetical protein
MKHLVIMMISLLLLTSACTTGGTSSGLVVKKRHSQFGAHKLPVAWHQKSFRGADLYFEHESKNASIVVSSQCEKLSDSPLEALTAQLLVGMGKYEIVSEKRLTIHHREALVSEIEVNLDGVNRYLKVMVLKKNACVFDAIFSAPKASDLTRDFDDMITTFWAEATL